MELSASHNFPQYPTRFQGVKLPASRLQLGDIDTVLFLVEHAPLKKVLTNLLATAAVCRAIACERGVAPSLKVMGENQFGNSMHGFGQNLFAQGILSGDHALLLTSASLYRRQMANLIGTYALAGATLDGFPELVDDDVVIGHRNDPQVPIRGFVESLVRDCRDPHVRRLLQLAHVSENAESRDPEVLSCCSALTTLQTTSFPFFRNGNKDRPEIIPTIHTMILEWRDGAMLPSVCTRFIEQHDEAAQIAQSIWSGASEIASGVFQLIEFPYEETDDVVRERLRDLYKNDPRAKCVLEKGIDRPATSLRYEEALAFERRVGAGEDAQGILDEVAALMNSRHDTSCMVDIVMGEERERDPKDTLDTILAKSKYIPDPEGIHYTVLKHPDTDFHRQLAKHHIPLITHNTIWLCDMKTGEARPVSLSFQGQHLDAFVEMIEGELP